MKKAKLNRVLFLAALAALATACKKDPQPEPWREAVSPWMWGGGMGIVPPKDTVAFYANDPTIKYVYIHILQADTYGGAWQPRHFNQARDSLQSRIDISPDKIRGRGIIKVGRDGARISPDTLTKKYGMWETDSLWFTKNGWRVERMFPRKSY